MEKRKALLGLTKENSNVDIASAQVEVGSIVNG